jgi:hypothetical protein
VDSDETPGELEGSVTARTTQGRTARCIVGAIVPQR